MGIDILGIDILGVDILGIDIPAPTPFNTRQHTFPFYTVFKQLLFIKCNSKHCLLICCLTDKNITDISVLGINYNSGEIYMVIHTFCSLH